jgi:hypothetical protein
LARTDFIFARRSAIASTWFGDSRRPGGGVFEAAIGIGASGFVADDEEEEDEDDDADEAALFSALAVPVAPASVAGCGGLPSEPAAACALTGSAQAATHAIGTSSARITRA